MRPKDIHIYRTLMGMKRVLIANPVAGSSPYTSGNSAARHYWYGRADVTEDYQVFFLTSARVIERRVDQQCDAEIERNRSGVVFWNGGVDPLERHRPGECRS